MTPTIYWLIAGAVCIGVEIFGIPGVGFLFAGMGALLVGGAIELGLIAIDNTLIQFLLFFAFTIASAALLWKRLKRTPKLKYHNMVGTDAVVAPPGLSGSQEGQVKWSGTLLRARIDQQSGIDVMAAGAAVVIRKVEGNLVFVAPKP